MKHMLAIAVLWVLFGAQARASDAVEDAQMVELDRARAEIADQLHLAAYDLIDELIYGWTQSPVFSSNTPVVLAGVTVPVGLGTGMQALVENHIAGVLFENPTTNMTLSHCPTCSAVVVHSGRESTVVTRGFDNPEVLEELGVTTGKHALFIDIEAEGTWLVLRARITKLTPDLPIIYSHTISTSASTPALLREPDDLKSAEEARHAYLAALRNRGPILIPLRVAVRSYADSFEETAIPPPPFIWLQSGVEVGATDARVWTYSLMAGYSFVPQGFYQGIMAQARISRLLTGRTRSITRPDLYFFAGAAVMSVWGPATGSFQADPLNSAQALAFEEGRDPSAAFGGLHLGLDLRVGNRVGFSTFLETLPSLRNSTNMGDYVFVSGVGFQTLGTEVTLWF